MDTPSQILGAKIAERLAKEGLITTAASTQMQSKLAEGKLRAEDWRLLIELGENKKEAKQ